MTTILTTAGPHNLQPGDIVVTTHPDPNKWRRFWHWMTFRDPPVVVEHTQVYHVTKTTVTLENERVKYGYYSDASSKRGR